MQASPSGHGRAQWLAPGSFFSNSIASVKSIVAAALFAITAFPGQALAGEVAIQWDLVDDNRVDLYEVHYGTQSGHYEARVDSASDTASVAGLQDAQTYYFAVRACDRDLAICSAFSNEVSATTGQVVPHDPPVAAFSASTWSGRAPLVVTLSDASSGTITEHRWNFGDGSASTATDAVHEYRMPGAYSVTLTVSGPYGTDSETKTDAILVTAPLTEEGLIEIEQGSIEVGQQATFAWESGVLVIDDTLQRVDFAQTYEDPIVIAKPMSMEDRSPAVVRVHGVDSDGFLIRVQEWDYLDGNHGPETVSYLVMESGAHRLPDGTLVEAGRVETDATSNFASVGFSQTFTSTPVVIAAVMSFDETDAVTTRIRNLNEAGFEVRMSEQEANAQVHASEEIGYIAWPASVGSLDGVRFEVGVTDAVVSHRPHAITFGSDFTGPPLFLADMQTANNGDSASLRARNQTETDVQVMVDEERSKDRETCSRAATAEAVGYIALEAL